LAFSETSGSQAHTVSTEHSLVSGQTTDEVLQLIIDTVTNPVAGDIFEFRLKDKVISSGSVKTLWVRQIAHAQAACFVADLVLVGLHAWEVTSKQTAGTGRTLDWSLRRVT
jgi:hypothetical protein